MRYRTLFVFACLLAVACEHLFGNLSQQDPDYCVPNDGTCKAGMLCHESLHRCVMADTVDGGSDGGILPYSSVELIAPALLSIDKINDSMTSEQGLLYRGDFDGNGLDDIFVMGKKRYTKIMNPSAGSPVISFGNYSRPGQNPEMAAVADIDDDGKDDVAVVLAGSNAYVDLIMGNQQAAPALPMLTAEPRGIAIGDFNGDNKKDIAVAYVANGIDIFSNKRPMGFERAMPLMQDVELANYIPTSMMAPVYRNPVVNTQDILISYSSGNGADGRFVRIRFALNFSYMINKLTVNNKAADVVVGHFRNSVNYDAVVVSGPQDLELFQSVEGNITTKDVINLATYDVDYRSPNKGKIAVGRLLSGSIANQLDDLVVLHADGFLSVYAGGGGWASAPARIANHSLIGQHVVAGRLAVGSSRDDIAVFNDSNEGATLSIARNQGGATASFTLPFDFRRDGANNPDAIVLSGSFAAVGSSDFAVTGSGGASLVLRCGPDGNQGFSCPSSQTVSMPFVAATTIQCAGQPTQVVGANANRAVELVTLGGQPGTRPLAVVPDPVGQLEVGDIDNDGAPDIVARSEDGKLWFLPGVKTQPCSFQSAFVTPDANFLPWFLPPASRTIRLADLNGDGLTDLTLGEQQQLRVYLGATDRPLGGSQLSFSLANMPGAMLSEFAVGDFRGQGKRELVAAFNAQAASQLFWLQLPDSGTTLFQSASTPLPMPTDQLIAADLNKDGRADVVVLHRQRKALSLVSGDNPNMVSRRHYALGPSPNWVAVGQLLGSADSPLDVIVADTAPRRDNINGSLWILQGIRGPAAGNQ